MKKTFFLFFLFLVCCVRGEIIELPQIQKTLNYVQKDDLVIFDIDNTLVEPVQLLGSDQWFYATLEKYKSLKCEQALEKVLSEYFSIQHASNVKTVEDTTQNVIETLQKQNTYVIGLTTRHIDMLYCTFKQFRQLNIDLTKTSICSDVLFFNVNDGVLYKKGILFCSNAHKGTALFSFLDKINYTPKRVVFINDKRTHLEQIENCCKNKNIPFLGLRYGYLDEKIKKMNYKIAEIQLEHFKKIISDEEALQILNQSVDSKANQYNKN